MKEESTFRVKTKCTLPFYTTHLEIVFACAKLIMGEYNINKNVWIPHRKVNNICP